MTNQGMSGEDAVMQDDRDAFLPQTPESYTYDLDGNQLQDGRWYYGWNAENRLTSMVTRADITTNVPRIRLEFEYDHQGRRIIKKRYSWDGDSWELEEDSRFTYYGWNLMRESNVDHSSSVTNKDYYVWGLDVSGTMTGAGGIGGLLHGSFDSATGRVSVVYAYDGNGNVVQLFNSSNRQQVAHYEYDPFGNTIRAIESEDSRNPFRFSTKYTDDESGLYYYGYRYYSPQLGRWINRDPIEEEGGLNVYAFLDNDPKNKYDYLGKMDGDVQGGDNSCGPDVTFYVRSLLRDVEKAYEDSSFLTKCKACYLGLRIQAGNGWDILSLKDMGFGNPGAFARPGRGPVGERTVMYSGRCYPAHAVNYLLWGKANKLCHGTFPIMSPPPIYQFGLNMTLTGVFPAKIAPAFEKLVSGEYGEAIGYAMGLPSAQAFARYAHTGLSAGLSLHSLPLTQDEPRNIHLAPATDWEWRHLR